MRLRGRKLGVLGVVVVLASGLALTAGITPAGAATVPAAPAKPVVSTLSTKAKVTWVAPANHGSAINEYIVSAYLAGVVKVTHAYHNTLVSEIFTGLANGKTYTFKVRAHNAVGSGPYSVASIAIRIGAPLKPAKPRVTRGNARVRVDWVAPANNGGPINGYVVTPYIGTAAQTAHAFATASLVHDITGLTNGTAYTFKVAAKNARGVGLPSLASLPATPTVQPALSAVMNTTIGQPILVDSNGMTVYLFVPDGAATTSTVTGPLRTAWPYVLWGGPASVGAGLNSTLATIHTQPDGTRLLAYNGHLLYLFINDVAPGDVTGQGLAQFFVLDASGNKIP